MQNHSNNAIQTAKSLLLAPGGIDERVIEKALSEMYLHRLDDADLYFQHTRYESWSLEEGIVKSGNFSIDQGVGVRAVSGDKTAFAYADVVNADTLMQAAKSTRVIGPSGGKKKIILQPISTFSGQALYIPEDPIFSLKTEEKIQLLEKIEQTARAKDPRVVQVMASLTGEFDVILVAKGNGKLVADIRPLVRVSISIIVEQNGRRETANAGGGGRLNYKMFTDDLINGWVDKAVTSALINLESKPAPAGPMTVVMGPGWPGVLLHEAIGHGLEGDFNRKGSSSFAGKLGQKVAAPGVTVVDDGTLSGRRGSLNVDDEGNPTQCTTLIENGRLKGFMQDAMNSRLMKMPLTGNGRRESYAALPLPRMTNTYMLGGDKDPGEILASIKKGLYAVNFGGGQVDITSGKFVFAATEAYWVENGKIQYPVKGATIIGNGPESLKQVSMIGNDLRLDDGVGVCGKEGQSVPVGVGQPTLRIENMVVGGSV
ncbi:peptidase C69 [Polynucleobacter sp. SHI8]|uniref:metalloprotease TldD n=1 Tax=unclassified Polynucleobacter TaxID=2640945 RepID=UPI0024921EC1|nr:MULTISPECIES: metalloprotease TldD [unclassified Polynucleobacter]BDW11962.1 peptidase C69 [Polynucleobacter sp. SHI2]BDW14409.1 peptidase C69 [Polynucleobacter sp. SHI8]